MTCVRLCKAVSRNGSCVGGHLHPCIPPSSPLGIFTPCAGFKNISPTGSSHGLVGKLSMTHPISSDMAMGYASASTTSMVPPHLAGPHQDIHKACWMQTSIACDLSVLRHMNIHLPILQQADHAAFRSLVGHSCPIIPDLSVNFELNSSSQSLPLYIPKRFHRVNFT